MRRFVRWLALASVIASASAACSKCGEQEKKPVAVDLAPVAAPDRLLADVYVMSPNEAWGKLQRGVGGAAGILPASAGGILCAAMGIDPAVAFEIDGVSPAFGVVAGDPATPAWGIALKLSDMRHARGILVDGETARFTPKEANGYTELLPKGQMPPPNGAVALTSNGFLVVTKTAADLPALAPYLTRNLPKQKAPEGQIVAEVPKSAITTVLKPKLETAWADTKRFLLGEDARMRKEHGGRAPDFGDPQAIVAALDGMATKRIDVLGDLEKMRIVVDIGEHNAAMVATLVPASPGGAAAKWIDGMKTGDGNAVLAMPQSSAVAFALRDTDDERTAASADIEKALTGALGARLAEADGKKVHEIGTMLAKARGETSAFALGWDEPRGLFVKSAVTDGDAAGKAIASIVELGRAAPFKEMLRVKDVATKTEELDGAKATVATITREPSKSDGASPPRSPSLRPRGDAGAAEPKHASSSDAFGFAWLVEGQALEVASGAEPFVTLRNGHKPDKKLADEMQTVKAVTALGTSASTVIVAQPLKFSPIRANLPPAPILIAIGRQEKNGFVKIDVATGILREISRLGAGF